MDNNGGDGDTAALFRVAYETLHGMAAGYLRGERIDHTLQPTALVHEAFLKLERPGDGRGWEGQTHFRAVAARAMRQILVDHARHRNSQKRGGAWQRVALSSGDLGEEEAIDFLALDEALERLADLSARKAEVVELRFFGGMTNEETAETLGISKATVKRDWAMAQAWLHREASQGID